MSIKVSHNAQRNAALLLQRRIFQGQEAALKNLQEKSSLTEKKADAEIPDFLLRRQGNSEEHSRFVGDVEIMLLAILNTDGVIDCSVKVQELLTLMTRVTQVDHRVLILHIVLEAMTDSARKSFVEHGGFRVLKRWIKVAEDEECVDELRLAMKVLDRLPFLEAIVKESEIGKSIKRLLKFKSEKVEESTLTALYADVRNLMTSWKQKLSAIMMEARKRNEIPKQLSGDFKDAGEYVAAIQQTLPADLAQVPEEPEVADLPNEVGMDMDVKEEKAIGESDSYISSNGEYSAMAREGEGVDLTTPESVDEEEEPMSVSPPPASPQRGSPPRSPLKGVGSPVRGPQLDIDVSGNTNTATMASVGVSLKGINRLRDRSRGTDRMIEGARRLNEALKRQNAVSDSAAESATAEQVPEVPALRSCLKRKASDMQLAAVITSDHGNGTKKKRVNMSVKWVDEATAKPIREVYTFEVDRIKNSVASYKSHKDLVRKEKALEKDLNANMIADAMQPTAPWQKPAARTLSLELRENIPALSHDLIDSKETAIQSKRLEHTLESKYLDDSLIPPDPDELPSTGIDSLETGSKSMMTIPWAMPGDEEEVASSAAAGVPGGPTEARTSSNGIFDDPEFAEVLNALPDSLRELEPELLLLIVQDEQRIGYILNDDGSVSDIRVQQLRNELLPKAPTQTAQVMAGGGSEVNGAKGGNRLPAAPLPGTWEYEQEQRQRQSRFSGNQPPVPGRSEFSYQGNFNRAGQSGLGVSMSDTPKLSTSNGVGADLKKTRKPIGRSSTPCKFYNSSKGCQFGDRCAFGHFSADVDQRPPAPRFESSAAPSRIPPPQPHRPPQPRAMMSGPSISQQAHNHLFGDEGTSQYGAQLQQPVSRTNNSTYGNGNGNGNNSRPRKSRFG